MINPANSGWSRIQAKHFEAGQFRQSQIEQNQERNGIAGAIRVFAVSGEVLDCRLTVSDFSQPIGDIRISKRAAQQQNILFTVLEPAKTADSGRLVM